MIIFLNLVNVRKPDIQILEPFDYQELMSGFQMVKNKKAHIAI
jgi:hypothetical protein